MESIALDIIGVVVDGGGSAITTGSKGYRVIPYPCRIKEWVVVADQSGSVVVDVKRSDYDTFPTFTTIAPTNKPTLSSAQKNRSNASLPDWSSLNAGDVIEFVVDSAATVQKLTVFLKVSRT